MDISSTVRVIASLVVVLLFLLVFLHYLRKFRIAEFSQGNGEINIIEKKYLGPNKYLVLIQVKERESLIAVANDKIEHLWTGRINELSTIDSRPS
jgi:flagellar biogenesis protein FliO